MCITESGDARDLRLAKFAPAGISLGVIVVGSGSRALSKIADAIIISTIRPQEAELGLHDGMSCPLSHVETSCCVMLMRVELHCIHFMPAAAWKCITSRNN